MTSWQRLRQNKTRKKKSASYETDAAGVHNDFISVVREFIIGDFEPRFGGFSNVYSVKIKGEDRNFFAKFVESAAGSEFHFYRLLLSGRIAISGASYTFNRILSIIHIQDMLGYFFEFIDLKEIRYNDISDVTAAIAAISEMNLVNQDVKFLRKNALKYRSFRVTDLPPEEVLHFISSDDRREDASLRKRHSKIIENWGSVVAELKNCKQSLISNDANSANLCITEGKVCFLDMGQACISPLGSDLFWLFREAKDILDEKEVVQIYVRNCTQFGFQANQDEIAFAAHAAFAHKWLNIKENVRSTLSQKSYRVAIESAEKCIELCK